MMSENNMVSYV